MLQLPPKTKYHSKQIMGSNLQSSSLFQKEFLHSYNIKLKVVNIALRGYKKDINFRVVLNQQASEQALHFLTVGHPDTKGNIS